MLSKIQDEAIQKTVEVASGGGMVKVVMNGKQRVVSLTLEPGLVQGGDKSLIQDLIVSAVNQAVEESQAQVAQAMQEKMQEMTANLGPLASLFKGM
jgi:DNA-binding YbaB/EbfC family protein